MSSKFNINVNLNNNKNLILEEEIIENENYNNNLESIFLKDKIPLFILDEISPLIEEMIINKNKNKNFYNTEKEKEELNYISFYDEILKNWIEYDKKNKELKNEKKLEENVKQWEKLLILKKINNDKIQNKIKLYKENINNLFKERENEELKLRTQQEEEMRYANINNIPLDNIVNNHIFQLNKFNNDFKEKLIEKLNDNLNDFNKFINIDYDALLHIIDKSYFDNDTKRIYTLKFLKVEKKNIKNEKEQIYFFKNFYYFNQGNSFKNQIKINFDIYLVNDLLYNDMKKILLLKEENKVNLYETLRKNYTFGDKIISFLNFFTFNQNENKLIHLNENLFKGEIINEIYFENIIKKFNLIEKDIINNNKIPKKNYITITKHSNLNSFDLIIHCFIEKFSKITDEEIINSFIKIINICNQYKIDFLIIPLEKILESFNHINKYSDFNNLINGIKKVYDNIKKAIQQILNDGFSFYFSNLIFIFSNSFYIGFEQCKNEYEFIDKLKTYYKNSY